MKENLWRIKCHKTKILLQVNRNLVQERVYVYKMQYYRVDLEIKFGLIKFRTVQATPEIVQCDIPVAVMRTTIHSLFQCLVFIFFLLKFSVHSAAALQNSNQNIVLIFTRQRNSYNRLGVEIMVNNKNIQEYVHDDNYKHFKSTDQFRIR